MLLKCPANFRLSCAAEDVNFTAAEPGDAPGEKKKLATFSMTGYTGAQMNVSGYYYPVVVDLAGLQVSSQNRPILLNHDAERIVGHSTKIEVSAQRLKLAGIMSGVGPHVEQITAMAGNSFPWQASLGASVQQLAFVDRGEKVNVNGRAFTGPLYVARRAVLGEVSFVPLGADSATSATVTASAENSHQSIEVVSMKFLEWLAAKGFTDSTLTDAQRATLEAAHKLEIKASEPAGDKDKPTAPPVNAKGGDGADEDDDEAAVKRRRKALAAEADRVAKVQAAAKSHPEISAKAIAEGWDENRTELEVLRASRPSGPGIHSHTDQSQNADVIRASFAIAGRLPNLEKTFKAETLDAAHKAYRGTASIQRVLIQAAGANGYHCDPWALAGNLEPVLRAAFSTLSLPGIFSDTANKYILAGFNAVESTWRRITKIGSVKDFRTVHRYRLTGDMKYEQLSPDGEITHGTLGEQTYTNKAKTFARMYSITREDIINDDLGALTDVPRMLGRGAALKVCETFWTEFLDNAAFFSAGNANYITGSGTVLSIAGLTQLEATFLDQTDPDGDPLAVAPKTLLVPNALKATADQIMASAGLAYGTADDKPTVNPHAGKWTVEASSYLNTARFAGGSATAYYLLADPMEMPVIETVFLNGREEPTIESAQADFNTLGVQMRGYHDFGHKKQEFRGGAKSKGAA